jgi:hypothetical protein
MKIYFLMALFCLVSCGDDKFNRVEELQGFRILGVIASNPEVGPNGGASNLRLIVSDPNGGGRIITGTTKSCIDPGISLGASVSCARDPNTVNGSYSFNTASDADLGSANLYTGLADQNLLVNVPATILTGRSARDQFNGVGYITIFQFAVDGKNITAFKRVAATSRGTLNTNPTSVNPVNILLNGQAITSKPNKNDNLKLATFTPETYSFTNVDGSQEVKMEEFSVAWYVSFGELNRPKADLEDDVKYLSGAPGSTMVVLSLLRDDRGGIFFERAVLP